MHSQSSERYSRYAPTSTNTTPHEEPAESVENPIRLFVEKVINLKTMHPWLRGLTIAALILVGVAALVLLSGLIPQPDVLVGLQGLQPLSMPLVAIVSAIVLLIIGWTYVIISTQQIHWSVRFGILALFTWLSLGAPFTLLHDPGTWHTPEHLAAYTQIGILIVLDGWGLAITGVQWWRRQQFPRIAGQMVTFGAVFLLLVGYYLAGAYGATQASGIFAGTLGLVTFASNIIDQVFFLLAIESFVVVWSSTDFLEWGELVVLGVVASLQRVRLTWLIIALPFLVALAMLIDAARLFPGWTNASSIGETVTLVLVCVILVALAGIDRTWTSASLLTALLAGALYLFSDLVLANELGSALHLTSANQDRLGNVIALTSSIVVATVGAILLLWRSGQGAAHGRASGLLLLLIVIFRVPLLSQNIVAVLGNHVAPLPPLSIQTFLFLAALITVIVLVVVAMRRPIMASLPVFVGALVLLIGVRVVFWIFTANEIASFGAQARTTTVVVALTFLAAVLWDVLTSGQQITNRNSRAFLRGGRVLLYLGYTLIATAMFILFSTLQPQVLPSDNGSSLPLYDLDGPYLAFGISELGIPLLITRFAVRLGQWLGAVAPAAPGKPAITRGLQVGVGLLGIGALIVANIAALRAPTLTASAPSQTYAVAVPGSMCDFKGAIWFTQNTTQCRANGLELTEDQQSSPGQYSASLLFNLPSPGLAKNFRVSMRIDMNHLGGPPADACAAIVAHITNAGWYITQACRNGAWAIVQARNNSTNNTTQQTVLKSGHLGHSFATVTLTTTANNTVYSINIDGKTMGSSQDATLAQSGTIAMSTVSDVPGTSIMSDFAYTPLP